MDLAKLRKLVALDVKDPLSRFALGKKLSEAAADDNAPELQEAAEHLRYANRAAPDHLATYHVLAGVLIRLAQTDEARKVLTEGVARAVQVGEGMGRDLAPAMQEMLANLENARPA